MMKNISIFMAAALLSACTTLKNMEHVDSLADNEGIALTICKNPKTFDTVLTVYPEDFKYSDVFPPRFSCSKEGHLTVTKLEAGTYYLGRPGLSSESQGFKNLPQFTIVPNKINYIGDIRFAVVETNIISGLIAGFKQPKFNISAVDRKEETLQKLREGYPDIAARYDSVTDITRKK